MTTYALGAVQAHVKAAAHELAPKFGIRTVGGFRAGAANHGLGLALDFMTPNRAAGDALAAYAWANRARLGVTEVIWRQRIITVKRAAEGWRGMEDRGSITQNHYDHVHLSFSSGGGTGGPAPSGGGIANLGGAVVDSAAFGIDGIASVGRFFAALGERRTWVRILQVWGGTGILVGGVIIVGRGTIAGAATQAVMTATPAGRAVSVVGAATKGAGDLATKAAAAAAK